MDMLRKMMRKQAQEDRYTELRERESRELMHEDADPEAAVEHEASGRQVSGHLQDGLAKQFLDKPGIPMPPIPRFRATLCCRWLLLVVLLIALVHWLGRFMTVQAFHDITHVKELELDVDNCDVEMAPLPPKLKNGAVTIQYWKFMSQIHRISSEEDKMTIQVDMRVKVPMFRCLISIFTNHSSLEKISGHIGGTQHCRVAMMEAISKEVQLVSQQVTMQFDALPQKVHLESSQGLVAIRPQTVPEGWDATIKAGARQPGSPSTAENIIPSRLHCEPVAQNVAAVAELPASTLMSKKSGYNIFSILNLILNAIGVGAVLWWAFASWRLHNLHSPLTHSGAAPLPAPVAKHVRGGKGGKHHAEHPDDFPQGAVLKGGAPPPFWVFCAGQWQDCWCPGDIRWGNEETWHVVPLPKSGDSHKVTCTIEHLPDNLPGDDLKHCECLIDPSSASYARTNAMMMEDGEAERLGATLVSSCELFFAARKKQPVDMAQWMAMEGLCSEDWEERMRFNRSMKAGPKQISLEVRQQLFRARVDARFKKIMSSLTSKSWFRRAFVTYVAGEPTSPFVQMATELIKSVHYFSTWPIIVFNFGLVTPPAWTPEEFPRLVILHSLPLPRENPMKRSFNFNKLRSILMSRVKTGIQLDVDQFIAPNADVLFKLTEGYVDKAYPFPLMPAHFLDWSIKDQKDAPWWPRYCPDPAKPCPMQTMRWAHAHPTWTYWALPFFGRWVRRHFRDERLPNVTLQGFEAPGLRVGNIPEDEDLLNVALWEERASKQWCKFDVPATVEFESLLTWQPSHGKRCKEGIGCSNIGGDDRWYKSGVPKVYWTAHHAVDAAQTAQILERIQAKEKEGKWPPAIVYDEKFWNSGEELHAAYPDLQCLT